jgi:hypothetical protein
MIPAFELAKTVHALDRAATVIGFQNITFINCANIIVASEVRTATILALPYIKEIKT